MNYGDYRDRFPDESVNDYWKRITEHETKHGIKPAAVRWPTPLRILGVTIERAAVLKDGVVHDVPRPQRHHDAIRACCTALGLESLGEHVQGFVTSEGEFVTRERAANIAYRSGQLEINSRNMGKIMSGILPLTSEDLW